MPTVHGKVAGECYDSPTDLAANTPAVIRAAGVSGDFSAYFASRPKPFFLEGTP